jgi:gamma-glutamyltranspeptidase/glutathione hydrolase
MRRMSEGLRRAAPVARGGRGAVVAPHHLATAAGLEVLQRGGSAVDAAIATNAALGVVAPNTSGLGGDAFWLIWDEATVSLHALAGAGAAPRRVDPDRLRAAGLTRLPMVGPLPITVPGAVRSWADAADRFGRASLSTILEPAARLADDGFAVSAPFARAVEETWTAIAAEPWAAGFATVYRPLERPWRTGEIVRLPAIAGTLRRLAEAGLDDLYSGGIARQSAHALADAGSPLDGADLAAHRSTWGPPLEEPYRDVVVATHPLPSCGIVALLLLAGLERLGPPEAAFSPAGWSDRAWPHVGIETATRALARRDAVLGDPDMVPIDVAAFLGRAAVDRLVGDIDPAAASQVPPLRTLVGGTAFVAAVDAAGNAASLITSNASGFGSGVVDAATGIAFHDRGQGFSLDPDHPNALAPGKRPLHSLLPAMLLRDGRPWIVVGSMGGDAQPQILAQLVSATVDGGVDIATAIAAPRWEVVPRDDPGTPGLVRLEAGFDADVAAALREMGHAIRTAAANEHVGHAHAIEIARSPDGSQELVAVTDPRSEGRPAVA